MLPVRSTQPIPKDRIMDLVLELANIVVEAPVKAGEIVFKKPLGLGADIVASRDLDRAK